MSPESFLFLYETLAPSEAIRMDLILLNHINAWTSNVLVAIAWLCLSYVFVTVVYNLYFHPLACYPGPFWARVSPFYLYFHILCKDVHLDIVICHARYGTFSRSGLDHTNF